MNCIGHMVLNKHSIEETINYLSAYAAREGLVIKKIEVEVCALEVEDGLFGEEIIHTAYSEVLLKINE